MHPQHTKCTPCRRSKESFWGILFAGRGDLEAGVVHLVVETAVFWRLRLKKVVYFFRGKKCTQTKFWLRLCNAATIWSYVLSMSGAVWSTISDDWRVGPLERQAKNCYLINNSTAHCVIALKYDTLVHGFSQQRNFETRLPVKFKKTDSPKFDILKSL